MEMMDEGWHGSEEPATPLCDGEHMLIDSRFRRERFLPTEHGHASSAPDFQV